MIYPTAVLAFITGRVRDEVALGGRVIITHLQKYSHFFVIVTWPFCFHFGLMWRLQQRDEDGHWIPGSEQGIYFRTPGYRWDFELGMIWTWGYFGLHLD